MLACDIDKAAPQVGMPFWKRAGVASKIDLRIGPGLDTLKNCLTQGEGGRYDFAFIDADKTGYDAYYEHALQLLRPGGLIMLDNVLRHGEVAYPSDKADVQAIQALNRKVHADGRVDMVLLPISDGVTLARKR